MRKQVEVFHQNVSNPKFTKY